MLKHNAISIIFKLSSTKNSYFNFWQLLTNKQKLFGISIIRGTKGPAGQNVEEWLIIDENPRFWIYKLLTTLGTGFTYPSYLSQSLCVLLEPHVLIFIS